MAAFTEPFDGQSVQVICMMALYASWLLAFGAVTRTNQQACAKRPLHRISCPVFQGLFFASCDRSLLQQARVFLLITSPVCEHAIWVTRFVAMFALQSFERIIFRPLFRRVVHTFAATTLVPISSERMVIKVTQRLFNSALFAKFHGRYSTNIHGHIE